MLTHLIKSLFRQSTAPVPSQELSVQRYLAGDLVGAERGFRAAIQADPHQPQHWINLAATLLRQHDHAAALPVLLQLVEISPDNAAAHNDLGICHARLQSLEEAETCFRRAIALRPDYAGAQSNLLSALMDSCEWAGVERWLTQFKAYRTQHPKSQWAEWLPPFAALTLTPGATAREVTEAHSTQIAAKVASLPQLDRPPRTAFPGRIRLGYVSADFYAHATMNLTFSLYAAHDRTQFEVFAYSIGRKDDSIYRKQVESTCDHFIELQHASTHDIAARIAADRIDILVDLKGYTANSRPDIFALRPAPVQVNYLGYPGTSGATFMDYYITDPVATLPEGEGEFTEALAYLPDSYQVNDSRQPIAADTPSRKQQGLPEHGFVFCSFNTMRKIEPAIFQVWMNILKSTSGSVLWLLRENTRAEATLRREAEIRGIDPQRLVFADKLDKPAHLARLQLADLFLDTWICNAHTTGSDALWAGLPILTCPGSTFARRVAASLLHAAGLPELVVKTLEEYETLAIQLAHDSALLSAYKQRLASQRLTCALFDTTRYVRHLESAFRTMHEAAFRGQAPRTFYVPRMPLP